MNIPQECRNFENFIRTRFSFKRFYDSYIILKTDIARRNFVLSYVYQEETNYHKKMPKEIVENVTDNLVDYMESELDRLEAQGKA